MITTIGFRQGETCANELCPNRIGEGTFMAVVVSASGRQAVLLKLCAPCADTMEMAEKEPTLLVRS